MNSEKQILPKDWKWVSLNEICSKITDGSHNPPKSKDSGLPMLSAKDIYNNRILFDEPRLISEEEFIAENKRTNISNGDVLLTIVATIGRTAVVTKNTPKFTLQRSVAVLKTNEDSHYVSYAFQAPDFQHQLRYYAKGTAQKGVYLKTLSQLEIPLPPLPIQQAIVSKIEELFSELDKGIEQLKTAQQQLKTYRQAVLKRAFEGKLTSKREEWQNVRLGDIANAIDPQPSHRTPPVMANGVPFVSIKDFDSNLDKIDFTHARKVSENVLNEHLERYKLEVGDFVIGKIGTIGKPVRIVLPQDYCLSANIVLIQPRKINATYLYYFFQSNIINSAFTAGVKATTQAAFGIQKVRELRIELPNQEEQLEIVSIIERYFSVANKMEESINESLQQAEVLRQSILKKAFEGKLP